MDSFRVESVRIKTTPEKAFRYISDPKNLPKWAHAFEEVQNGKATMATPAGAMEVGLRVRASASEGTIDWHMTFPDGNVASASSSCRHDAALPILKTFAGVIGDWRGPSH